MSIKRTVALLLVFCTITFNVGTIYTAPSQTDETAEVTEKATFPKPRAKATLLYDLNGGRVLYEDNPNEKNYPASLTKIMTALLLLEKGDLSKTVTVSQTALDDITYLHSKLGLKAGEQISVENLLISLLVCSANDSANVIAEYISGDIPSFIKLMNTRAKELGMTGTNFVNAHGFHDDNHYSTASDIAIVAKEAMKYDKFCEIVKIKTIDIPATNMSDVRKISSTNHLVSRYRNTYHYYPYATGLKTGSTTEAGSCLVATAQKNGVKLLSVVLGCDNENLSELAYSFVDTTAMFEFIFNNYKTVTIASKADIVADHKVKEAKDATRVALSPSADVIVLLPKDYNEKDIKPEVTLVDDEIYAPIEKGIKLGTAKYSFDTSDKNLSASDIVVDLTAANEVKRDFLLYIINRIASFLSSPFVVTILILVLLFVFVNAYNNYKRRQARRRRMKSHRPMSAQNRQNQYQSRQRPHTTQSRRTTSRTPDPWDKYR